VDGKTVLWQYINHIADDLERLASTLRRVKELESELRP
jgi:hypothetical protein